MSNVPTLPNSIVQSVIKTITIQEPFIKPNAVSVYKKFNDEIGRSRNSFLASFIKPNALSAFNVKRSPFIKPNKEFKTFIASLSLAVSFLNFFTKQGAYLV